MYKFVRGTKVYKVGDDGSVWSRKGNGVPGCVYKWKKLKPRPVSKYGHLSVALYINHKRINAYVHHLVLEAFGPTRKFGQQARHLNGNPKDNNVTNLRWGTFVENKRDSIQHGTHAKGSKNGSSKLTEVKVIKIKRLLSKGVPRKIICKIYKVHDATVWSIENNRTWKWLNASNN